MQVIKVDTEQLPNHDEQNGKSRLLHLVKSALWVVWDLKLKSLGLGTCVDLGLAYLDLKAAPTPRLKNTSLALARTITSTVYSFPIM